MNKIKICLFCLMGALMFSCTEDYSDFESKAYLNSDTRKTMYLIKPDATAYSAELSIGVPKAAAAEMEFTLKADASLVQAYNSAFADKAIMLPADNYKLATTKTTIAEGSVRSKNVEVEFININQLDRDLVYVLPVTIASATNVEVLESARTHYYIFKGGALINWAADIESNYFPVNWGNKSLVSGMSTLTIESMLYLRQAEREGSDSQIMTFFGVENVFLIRLGDTFEAGQVMVVKGSGKYPDNGNDRTKVPVGKWFHLAITLDESNSLKIYIDGELMSTSAVGSGTVNLADGCNIGKSYNDNRWWPGMICETRLWNVARTKEEIAAGMYSVAADTPGLVAYWKFNEGQGNTIADHSGSNSPINANSKLSWTSVQLPE